MKKGKKEVRCDIQQRVTDCIIKQLEQGNLSPWQCPWTKTGETPIPYNWQTKQSYNGINVFLLWHESGNRGYTTNAWLTFKQAQQLGGCVKKGEKSVRCIFYKTVEVEDRNAELKKGKDRMISIPCFREFSLFNIEQVDGLSDLPAEPKQPEYEDDDIIWAIDTIAKEYCKNTNVAIKNGSDQAYYSPTLDQIKLPTTFHKGSDYAATLAHELIHSTGHKSRLDRFNDQSDNFSSFKEFYAFEELVAELGAAFICAELQIEGENLQHASYIDCWLRVLKSDKTFFFKAAAQAGKAYRLLMQGGVMVEAPLSSAA